MSPRVVEAARLLRLKDQRLDTARLALAVTARGVRAAEEQLARRDAAIAAVDARQARMAAWFADPPSDPRLIATALACREHLVQQRQTEADARLDDVAALDAAEARRADAAREVGRAQARRDAADQMLQRLRREQDGQRERRVEQELEERHARTGAPA